MILPCFPTRRSSDLNVVWHNIPANAYPALVHGWFDACWFIRSMAASADHGRENSHLTGELRELLREFGRNWKGNCRLISLRRLRSEEHTSELQSREN